jgi:hypothetical protein
MMIRPRFLLPALALVLLKATSSVVEAFAMAPNSPTMTGSMPRSLVVVSEANGDEHDASEVIARRITLKGAVQGGYYRSCVLNEVRYVTCGRLAGDQKSCGCLNLATGTKTP